MHTIRHRVPDLTHREVAERPFRQLREDIATRRGDSLENVERELIAPSGLSEELQSALWLYGWSLSQ
jgi:hypothetical protein